MSAQQGHTLLYQNNFSYLKKQLILHEIHRIYLVVDALQTLLLIYLRVNNTTHVKTIFYFVDDYANLPL